MADFGHVDIVEFAVRTALNHHFGQVDKQGQPVALHLMAVAAETARGPLIARNKRVAVAWLHDILEDTDCTYEELRARFGEDIADAVEALTPVRGQTHRVYMDQVCANSLAKDVKLCEVRHNLWHIKDLYPETQKRLWKKYQYYLGRLIGIPHWQDDTED